MQQDHSVIKLLEVLEASVLQLEAHVRSGQPLPNASFLSSRRRAAAMLRAALRYAGYWLPERRLVAIDWGRQTSSAELWQTERHIVQLYRDALLDTAPDAPEYRLLVEQCAMAEAGLGSVAGIAYDWRPSVTHVAHP